MTELPMRANYNLEVDKYYKFVSFMGTVRYAQILKNERKHHQIYTMDELLVYPLSGGSKAGRGERVGDVDGIDKIFELDDDDVLMYIVMNTI
jgi:hypothetical protein